MLSANLTLMSLKKIIFFILASCGVLAFFVTPAHHLPLGENTENSASHNISSEPAPNQDITHQAKGPSPEMDVAALGQEVIFFFNTLWPVLPENEDSTPGMLQGVVEKGDTISKILEEAGENSPHHYINAMRKVFSLGAIKAGQPYTVITDPNSGQLKRFEYEINSTKRLVVEGSDNPTARLEKINYSTSLELVQGVIDDNLFQAIAEAGENPQLAVRLTELFGSEINFIRDLQKGDSFAALVEKRHRNGEYKGYGRILAARFTNKGKTWEAFLYNDQSGQSHYYNSKGENLKKTLLQAPLAITRVTSRFTNNRKHPLLGYSRPHHGVDYGAPTGTPVKAVGSGVVTKRGWAGGYGNQIIIRHNGSLESMYSHLSGFARGLKEGQKIRQGQVIGFVGSTGLSTGPHLDFRLRQNGEFVNPTKAINPRGASVPANLLASFKNMAAREKTWLDGKPIPEDYTVNSLVPVQIASDPVHKSSRQALGKQKTGRRAAIRPKSRKRS